MHGCFLQSTRCFLSNHHHYGNDCINNMKISLISHQWHYNYSLIRSFLPCFVFQKRKFFSFLFSKHNLTYLQIEVQIAMQTRHELILSFPQPLMADYNTPQDIQKHQMKCRIRFDGYSIPNFCLDLVREHPH